MPVLFVLVFDTIVCNTIACKKHWNNPQMEKVLTLDMNRVVVKRMVFHSHTGRQLGIPVPVSVLIHTILCECKPEL
jgi:hypothetical protein